MRLFRDRLLPTVCRFHTAVAPRFQRPSPALLPSCLSTRPRSTNRRSFGCSRSAWPSTRQESVAQRLRSTKEPLLPPCEPLQAGASSILLVLVAVSATTALYAFFRSDSVQVGYSEESRPEEILNMTEIKHEAQPGRVGNLTPEQEQKLRELWAAIFKVCAIGDVEGEQDDAASTAAPDALADKSTNAKEKPKKRRITMFSRKGHKDKNGDSDSASTASGVSSSVKADDADDKYGQNKQFLETLASVSPETIRATIWDMVKHDHPDALVLRFLRARKWDVNKALVMLVSTMNWRATEMHVDDEIMKNGEAAMVELSQSDDPKKKQLGDDFMAQIRMGKSFLHGLDDMGRPICVVRVRCHHQGEQCEESLERYTVYLIETARMVLRPPVDTATVLFDMTGFSMANMDYTPLKFMIKCFEANYPESLGSVLVHKAPWIFQGIWKVIRGWLDPVVASKVHFTNNIKDLEQYISPSRVPKELDGEEDFEYKYVEPIPGENDKMKDVTTRDGLLAAREQLYLDYEEATANWIKNPEDATIKAQRDSIAAKLRVDYWNLDAYVRARSLCDRTHWIQGEKVEPYPTKKEAAVQTSEHGIGTSSDDLD